MPNLVLSMLLGDLSIFQDVGYAKYWKNNSKITKNDIRIYFFGYLGLYLGILLLQWFNNVLSFELLFLESVIFLLTLRFVLLLFQSRLNNFKIKAEMTGFFVLN